MSAGLEPSAVQQTADDRRIQRKLGFWSLVSIGIGSVIGSGWLFSAMNAAHGAGPAAMISWLIGGAIMLAMALVVAELGMTFPESGGLSRYPLYSHGKLVAALIGWCSVIAVLGIPALEAAGAMQYASTWVPGLFKDDGLTMLGIGAAALLLAGFTALNYFGVRLFARSTTVVTAIKVWTPVIAVIALAVSSFAGNGSSGGVDNFTKQGFAPFGWTASLAIIATTGILFAFNGAQVIVTVSGEVENPRRTIPRAMIVTMLVTIVLYLALQAVFVLAAPADAVAHGWGTVSFDSPYSDLALLAGMQWLSWILIADAGISPSGAAVIVVAANARNVYALSKNRFLPGWLQKIDDRWGVPRRALVVNYLIGLVFLVAMPSWSSLISVIGVLIVFTIGIPAVSVGVFRRVGITAQAGTALPGVGVLAPLVFAAGGLVLSWVPSEQADKTIPILLIGVIWYGVTYASQKHGIDHLRSGVWLVLFFTFLYVADYLGSFGTDVITAPWDSIIVFLGSLAFYRWGVNAGARHMADHPLAPAEQRVPDDGELSPLAH
ncbi:APC family permease [Streptomyces sp. NPDC090075]|uniref:APC family permease n=1 Tax=Streptomyces sp. NPDC090075 TaxID=3365937 RepID=UPI003807BF06